MIIKIPGYSSGYKIVSLAKDTICLNDLLFKGLEALFVDDSGLYFFPGEEHILVESDIIDSFSLCSNYDVFEISEEGNAYCYYNNSSVDNAVFITGKCNSNCVMCPASAKERKLGITAKPENLLLLLKHIPEDAVHLTFTGGEPFLIGKDIFRVFEAAKEKFRSASFLLLTNGRVFALKDYCLMLKKTLPEQTIIAIPLHGPDAYLHDSITAAPGSFLQTTTGLKNLLQLDLHVEIRIVVSRLNKDFIELIADLIIREFRYVTCVKIIALEMMGNALLNKEKIWIPYREAYSASKTSISKLLNAGIDVGLYNFPLCFVDKEHWSIAERSITDYKIRFSPVCQKCSMKDACGGIFSSSFRFTETEVHPIG